MATRTQIAPLLTESQETLLFPSLTSAQIARIAAGGQVRHISPGEILVEVGDRDVPFFVVRSGQIEIVQPSLSAETLIVAHGPGKFTGEVNLIAGRRSLTRYRVSEAGEVVQLTREQLLN